MNTRVHAVSGSLAARWTALCVVSLALGLVTRVSAQGFSLQGLGHLHDRVRESAAYGVSADGSVVVGNTSTGGSMGIAFRWTEASGVVSLGTLDTFPWWYPYSAAYGVSADGSVIVGMSSYGDGGMQAIRWTQAEGMVGLGDLPGGDVHSSARAISAGGSVIVGWGTSGSGTEAFRWTEAGGWVGLGDLPGGTFYSIASAVSADGSVVVGSSRTDLGDEPFIWDAEHGMRNLKSVLIAGGLNLTGWTLYQATGVSADGLTIVGVGVSPEGQTEAWRATLAPLQWNEPPIASFTLETDGLTATFDASRSSDPDGSVVG